MQETTHRTEGAYRPDVSRHDQADSRYDHHARDEAGSRPEDLQRSRYGGFHFGAAFFGWLVANSVAVLMIALLTALGGAVALTSTTDPNSLAGEAGTIGLVGAMLLLITLGTAYYAGGYVAGRMSRFDGARQGIGVWLIGIIATVLLGILGAVFGANYNLLQQLNLPAVPVDGQTLTSGGLITALALLAATALAAAAGGKMGVRYHHKVDAAGQSEDRHYMPAGHSRLHRAG